MNLSDAAILLQRTFLCAFSSAVSGSTLMGIYLILEKIPRWKDSRLRIWWLRSALVVFLLPISLILILLEKISYSMAGLAWLSVFWDVSTTPMQKLYMIVMGAWTAGLLCGLVFRIRQYLKLKFILKGNVPVEDSEIINAFEELKEKYGFKRVKIYQNDLLKNPICAGGFSKMIILPFIKYSKPELKMIFEHEMVHIRNRDLELKKLALLATFIHWWNPLVYILLERVCLLSEVEADIVTCENGAFSKKEYAEFLYGLNEEDDSLLFVSAISKAEKNMYRRMESMVRGKSYKKRVAVITSILLVFVSVIPSYAATGEVVKMNEKWIEETEVEVEDMSVADKLVEQTAYAGDDNVTEVEDETEHRGSTITLDRTINGNTRVLYSWKNFSVGDSIYISAKNAGTSSFKIGIRDRSGTIRYISGTGRLTHQFDITVAGDYTAFVENTSSSPITITGTAVYNN